MLRFRPAQGIDAAALAPRLRQADADEIQAAVGLDPERVLTVGIRSSDPCWAVTVGDDKIIALFGVEPEPASARRGVVWMLGSDELAIHSIAVLRLSRHWLDRLHERYDCLWNYIDQRNERHIEWLRWCGFDFLELIEHHGFEQRPFWRFERRSFHRRPFACGASSFESSSLNTGLFG